MELRWIRVNKYDYFGEVSHTEKILQYRTEFGWKDVPSIDMTDRENY